MNSDQPETTPSEPVKIKKPAGNKRWWTLTKAILGHVLPILIIGSLVAGIFSLVFLEDEDDDPQEDRRLALEENWEEYVANAAGLNREIDLDKFNIDLCPFTEDEYTWDNTNSPEGAGMICGYVTVPLYHQDPEGDTIQIPVVIWPYPEQTKNLDPVFIMQGGPGGSTLDMYPDWFYGYESRPVGEREIVFVDQRGTRYSEPSLVCSEIDEADEPEEEEENGEEGENEDYLIYLKNCHDRLVSEGVDLSAFNTAEIAHDMEFIRKTFDYPAINFYGVSYGSHIGQYLAAFHPEGLRSLILDGVAPIPLNYLDNSYSHANRLLEDYLVECDQDSFCSENYPGLIDRINERIDNLDEKPDSVTLHDPNSSDSITEEITGEFFLYYLIYMFRMDSSYAILPYLVNQAEEGHFDLYKWYGERLTFEEVDSDGLFYAVVSGEHTPLHVPEEADYLIPKLSEIEVESAEDNLAEFAVWDVKASTEILTEMPSSEVPTLLMSGFFDPTTPPQYGETALESFPNGQHVIDPLGGHGIAFSDGCTEQILVDFLEEPQGEVEDECLAEEDRKYPLVPPNAISAPFQAKMMENVDFLYLSWLIPPLIFLMMMFRGVIHYLLGLWQVNRGKVGLATPRTNLLRLRFELSTWVFMIGCLAYIIYLNVTLLNDSTAHLAALAYPGRYRGILFIALLLALITPAIFTSAVELWLVRRKVFARTYQLLQVVFSGFFLAYLVWSGLLWAWAR